MKKLLMFLCCVFALNVNIAWGDNCPASGSISLQDNQNGKDNELVYTSMGVYEEVVQCSEKNAKSCKITKGKVYECDAKHGCAVGTFLLADNGWIRGKRNSTTGTLVGNKMLYCNASVGDVWKINDIELCPDDLEDARNGNIWQKLEHVENAQGKECYIHSGSSNGRFRSRFCCKDADGKKPDNNKKPTKPSNGKPTKTQTDSGTSVTDVNEGVIVEPETEQVVVQETIVLESFNCELDDIMPIGWEVNYASCKNYIDAAHDIKTYCETENKTKAGYDAKLKNVEKLFSECKKTLSNRTNSSADISKRVERLDEIFEGLRAKITVWKDSEGNFNTARLASDSIAGVVLGTAGGLITSHVVKKNQVKKGFESVQCTIGGQKVADWGDEFTVGIR